MIEVFISGMQDKIVLENESSKPHVIRWNRCSLFSQLPEDRGVVVRCLIVGEDDMHAVLLEEPAQDFLILCFPAAMGEPSPQLAKHDEGQDNCFRFLEKSDSLRGAFA